MGRINMEEWTMKEHEPGRLTGKQIAVGICACGNVGESLDFLKALKHEGAEVEIIATENAAQLISPLVLQRLSNKPVLINQFELPKVFDTDHWRKDQDLLLVAPASANTVAKAACGIADNLLTARILAARCPVAYVLRCNPMMFEKPATQRNIQTLISDGAVFLNDPEKLNKFPAVETLIDKVVELLKD